MYVSGRCHKDATPRVAPASACHAMRRHAKQCGYFLIMQSENYSTNYLPHHLILHLHPSIALPIALVAQKAERGPASRQDRRALAAPSPPPAYLLASYRRCCISTPLLGSTIDGHELRATGMSASSVLLVRRVAWRGIGGAVGRGGESSCTVCCFVACVRGDWGCNGSARSLRVRVSDWAPRDMAPHCGGPATGGGWMAASRW